MKQIGKFLALLGAIFTFVACDSVEDEPQTDIKLSVTPSELTFESEGGLKSITLSAPSSWQVEITKGEAWLGVNKLSGELGEGQTINISAWENSSTESRTGEIYFHSGGGAAILTITQKGYEEVIPEGPELPVATNENTYVINGTEKSFRAAAFMMVGENPSVMATTQLGVSGAEAILASNNYFYGAVSPLLVGTEFDITTESTLFTLLSTLSGATIETAAPGMTEELTAGKACLKIEGEKATLTAGLILADGTTLAVNISAKVESGVEINENIILRDAERKPVRASFYMKEDGMTYLYFTSAGIDYAEELDIAVWYMYLMISDDLVAGKTIDIESDQITSSNFILGVMDNADYSASWAITKDDLQGATGSFYAKENSEGNYSVLIDIDLFGTPYYLSFEGKCRSCYDTPVVESNYLIYNQEKFSVTGATIDSKEEPWRITFNIEGGTTLTATLPASFVDGNAHGFSQSDLLTVSYNGETYSYANGNSGTVTALLNEENFTLDFAFTNYKNCEISYSGAVTIYE